MAPLLLLAWAAAWTLAAGPPAGGCELGLPEKPPPAKEAVLAAAASKKLDPKACLCRYLKQDCPGGGTGGAGAGGYTADGPGAGTASGFSADDKRTAAWKKYGENLFDKKQPDGGVPHGWIGGGGNNWAALQAAAKKPGSQLPADFKTKSAAPPLSGKDKVINTIIGVANMEMYSRAGTLNRESKEGSRRSICGFLARSNWDPAQAWMLSKAARDAPGADPGDLDLRNAEHYLYAYSTTDKPSGWGDSVPIQVLMAVGWTPFKTATKYFRPTSTPSADEWKWGVDGALDGWRKPDWKTRCSAKPS